MTKVIATIVVLVAVAYGGLLLAIDVFFKLLAL